jgi:hypothetical protein
MPLNLRFTPALLLTVWLALPIESRAQSANSAAAQALFDQGKALMAAGRVSEACPKFEESQRIEARSGTLINLAQCYEKTGRPASAWAGYIDSATAARADGNAEREAVARELAASLAPKLSKLVITVAPAARALPGFEVQRDRASVGAPAWGAPLPSDPGVHRIVAKAPGRRSFETQITVEGEGRTFTVQVPELAEISSATPMSSPAPDLGPVRVAAIAAGGVGIAGLALGTVFGLISKSKHDEAAKSCSGSTCTDQRGVTASDSARTAGNISTVAMVLGGVGLAAGVTLWLTAPRPHNQTPRARLELTVGGLKVAGAF